MAQIEDIQKVSDLQDNMVVTSKYNFAVRRIGIAGSIDTVYTVYRKGDLLYAKGHTRDYRISGKGAEYAIFIQGD